LKILILLWDATDLCPAAVIATRRPSGNRAISQVVKLKVLDAGFLSRRAEPVLEQIFRYRLSVYREATKKGLNPFQAAPQKSIGKHFYAGFGSGCIMDSTSSCGLLK
jgi:hypothetical protein